jgi:hypothetical protein
MDIAMHVAANTPTALIAMRLNTTWLRWAWLPVVGVVVVVVGGGTLSAIGPSLIK